MKPSGIVVSVSGYYAIIPEFVSGWVRFIQPVGVNRQSTELNIEDLLG